MTEAGKAASRVIRKENCGAGGAGSPVMAGRGVGGSFTSIVKILTPVTRTAKVKLPAPEGLPDRENPALKTETGKSV